ncbi:hypothetical protein D3C87_499070 [compost metagenome]
MKQLAYISLILISTISCLGQVENKPILKQEEDKDERIFFTKELSEKYGLPPLPFSIVVPKGYSYQFNHKTRSAIRIYKYEEDSLINEIAIGISSFDKKYSEEQEKLWLEEFKNSPQAKQNPDFSIQIYTDYLLLGTKRNFYTYSIDNKLGKYPVNIPLNSVGITHPSKDGWSGLAIVVTKWKIDVDSPLLEIEKEIINSIRFE